MMNQNPECIFCKIVSGVVASERIHETPEAVVFLDVAPTTRGHSLIIPRSHTEHFHQMDSHTVQALADIARIIAPKIQQAVGASGYNLVVNTGRSAGQMVQHVHLHIIPRYDNDVLRPWPGSKRHSTELSEVGKILKEALNR